MSSGARRMRRLERDARAVAGCPGCGWPSPEYEYVVAMSYRPPAGLTPEQRARCNALADELEVSEEPESAEPEMLGPCPECGRKRDHVIAWSPPTTQQELPTTQELEDE